MTTSPAPVGTSAWKFRRRQPACSVCERPFEDGELHFSVLSIRDGELAREDPCVRCWDAASRAPATGAAPPREPREPAEPREPSEAGAAQAPLWQRAADEVFWWRTRHLAAKKRGIALNLPALEALFLSLEGRRERSVRELRYLLCLILMRKRRLKLVRIKREPAGESFEVRRPRRQESSKVWVFDFTPERIDALRSELVALFDAHEEGTDSEEDRAGAPDEGSEVADGSEAPQASDAPEDPDAA